MHRTVPRSSSPTSGSTSPSSCARSALSEPARPTHRGCRADPRGLALAGDAPCHVATAAGQRSLQLQPSCSCSASPRSVSSACSAGRAIRRWRSRSGDGLRSSSTSAAAVLALVQLVCVRRAGLVVAVPAAQPCGVRCGRPATPHGPDGGPAASGVARSPSARRWWLVPLSLVLASFRVRAAGSRRPGGRSERGPPPTGSLPPVDRCALRFAVAATLIAVVIGGLAALAIAAGGRGGRLLDVGLMLPLGTSAVTIGFGFADHVRHAAIRPPRVGAHPPRPRARCRSVRGPRHAAGPAGDRPAPARRRRNARRVARAGLVEIDLPLLAGRWRRAQGSPPPSRSGSSGRRASSPEGGVDTTDRDRAAAGAVVDLNLAQAFALATALTALTASSCSPSTICGDRRSPW